MAKKSADSAGIELFEKHAKLMSDALAAIEKRHFWSPFPEIPSTKIYGETAKDDGLAAFEAARQSAFELPDYPTTTGQAGAEKSPYGVELNIQYPTCAIDTLIEESQNSRAAWATLTPQARAGICLEILTQINRQSFFMAHAVMHTTGQAFPMAFQAGGPHAQDRGLEALAYAFKEMQHIPAETDWQKPMGKHPALHMHKQYKIIPRGIGLTIGCATFPTWNSYPSLFANLVTGNSVIIKPHPNAILPLAITTRIMREVFCQCSLNPNLVLLAVDEADAQITKELAARPEIALIDYTGSNQFAQWLKDNCRHAQIYTEEAGINTIMVTATDNLKGMTRNIAMSLCLYSGQMCTTPQNIYIPKDGIMTDEGQKSFDDIAAAIKAAIDGLLSDAARGAGVLGAICNPATLERINQCTKGGEIIRPSAPLGGETPNPNIVTPLLVKAEKNADICRAEQFGPISFLIPVTDGQDAIDSAAALIHEKGAITASLYATEPALIDRATQKIGRAGAVLSVNLTGQILINQSAAFSDYHVSGANPAGNATLADAAFVANRFCVAETRTEIAEQTA